VLLGLLDALLALLLSLPYSRLMEREADILGLDNMVAACIHVHIPLAAAVGLWKRMAAEAARKDRLKERASVVHILVCTVLVMVPLCLGLNCFLNCLGIGFSGLGAR
jgi:hypothetical protein